MIERSQICVNEIRNELTNATRRIAFEDLSAFTRRKNLGTLVQAAD